ncbi:hypothetical protein THAOC_32992, partial [Thalassiosira oceanica]
FRTFEKESNDDEDEEVKAFLLRAFGPDVSEMEFRFNGKSVREFKPIFLHLLIGRQMTAMLSSMLSAVHRVSTPVIMMSMRNADLLAPRTDGMGFYDPRPGRGLSPTFGNTSHPAYFICLGMCSGEQIESFDGAASLVCAEFSRRAVEVDANINGTLETRTIQAESSRVFSNWVADYKAKKKKGVSAETLEKEAEARELREEARRLEAYVRELNNKAKELEKELKRRLRELNGNVARKKTKARQTKRQEERVAAEERRDEISCNLLTMFRSK